MKTPIERMVDGAGLRCTICGAPMGQCGCWTKCQCGRTYRTGEECDNPVHAIERAAVALAADLAFAVIGEMRGLYPEPMKAASGGFRKTLDGVLKREAKARFIEAFNACEDVKRKG